MVRYEIYETSEGKYIDSAPVWVKEGYMKHYQELCFEDYYAKIKCPVLFLPGEKEWKNKHMQNALNHFRSFLEQSKVVHIAGATHAFLWLLKPKEASKVVLNFLETVKSG